MAIEAKSSANVGVIGGAGFLGLHLVDALVAQSFPTSVIDNLDPQVHPVGSSPAHVNPRAEFVHEDVRNLEGLCRALEGLTAIYELAGAVGVGDSMFLVRHYAEANGEIFNVGTGRPTTTLEPVRAAAKQIGAPVALEPSYQHRTGDVRHCSANITTIHTRLGFEPRFPFPAGAEDLSAATEPAQGPAQSVDAHGELAQHGLIS
jgi:nucleoside-diphosphate-sugar epimerase